MKKIILISLISLTLLTSCEIPVTESKITQSPTVISDNEYSDVSDAEVQIYVDPDTNVEYLIFDFKGTYEPPIVVPRYNSDGTLKCLD